MRNALYPDMLDATRLTRAGRLTEATAFLQRVLRGETAPDTRLDALAGSADAPAERAPRIIDVTAEATDPQPASQPDAALGTGAGTAPGGRAEGATPAHMPEALRRFLGSLSPSVGGSGGLAKWCPAPAPDVVPDDGQFLARFYSSQAGSRAYKLYVPSLYRGQSLPLVVMLHGCTQSPDDFAAGTRMNALAEEHACLVAYPAQTTSANANKCWNWFNSSDQQRDQGEPSLIAGITREIMRDYSVDPQRIYVAGLSAGAAAAAVMGMTYPDLYAAIGVHSGLACGAASNMPSAFAAMRQGRAGVVSPSGSASGAGGDRRIVPTIVFHGDQDTTVNPLNGDHVIAQASAASITGLEAKILRGRGSGGLAYSRTLYADTSGRAILEQWVVHGAGHAWSGGSPAGSYTDPRGPDAAREMLRFFLDHPHDAHSR